MAGIDYRTPKATWTQKANGQWRVQIRVKVPTGTDAEGRTIYSPKRLSKQFSPDESAKLTTERKRVNALNKWIESLEQADADADAAKRREQEDARRKEQEEAQRKEQAKREAIESAKPRNKTIAEYVTAYIDALESAGSVRPSAISDYRTSVKRIAEGIGEVKLADLTPTMIQAWEADLLNAGRGVNTVLKYHRLLNSVYNYAIRVRDFDWNPCAAVVKPKRVAPSPNSLTAEQHARLLATLAAMGPSPIVTAATIAAYTGMREGEITGLKWKCYDADSGTIHIAQSIAKAGGKTYVSDPKTAASKRDIPVHSGLAAMLDRRRAAMVAELEEKGVTLSESEFAELYVCGSVEGRYLDNTHLSRSWKALADAFDLTGTQGRRVTFHDLRHSFATRAIAAGADVKSVAAVLGHTDAHVTLNVYADADKESKRRAVNLMGAAIAAHSDAEPFAELAN